MHCASRLKSSCTLKQVVQTLFLTHENNSDLDTAGGGGRRFPISRLSLRRKQIFSCYQKYKSVPLSSGHQLLGVQFVTILNANLHTSATRQSGKQNNCINSHAQDTTVLQPNALLTEIRRLLVRNI